MTQTPDEPLSDEPRSDEPLSDEELDSVEEQYDEVYGTDPSPDLEAARRQDEKREEAALTTEGLTTEELTGEYDAPDRPSTPTALGETEFDEHQEETIEDRLAQEEPEQQP